MIISFILDGILSLYISQLIPLFTLTSIVLKSTEIKDDYLMKYSLILGLLYDIAYTNTIGLNALIFFLLNFIIFRYCKKNIYFLNSIVIIVYLVSIYLILSFFNVTYFNFLTLLIVLIKALVLNNIYLLILISIKKIWEHKFKQVRKWRILKR